MLSATERSGLFIYVFDYLNSSSCMQPNTECMQPNTTSQQSSRMSLVLVMFVHYHIIGKHGFIKDNEMHIVSVTSCIKKLNQQGSKLSKNVVFNICTRSVFQSE